jgi:tRNA 2-thiouridine synthesizing protein D
MTEGPILLLVTHGTYGRDDEAYGALLAGNSILAKGMETTLVLLDDGVYMAKTGQQPQGMPNNLTELQDFIALGGTLLCIKESLETRGLSQDELVPDAQIIALIDLLPIIDSHPLSLTF